MSLPATTRWPVLKCVGHFVEHDFVQIFFLLVGPWRQFPFRDVRIDEHRSVGVAFAVILRMQRAEADRHFAFDHAFIFQDRDAAKIALEVFFLIAACIFLEVQHGRRRLQFAARNDPFAAGSTSIPCGDLPIGT